MFKKLKKKPQFCNRFRENAISSLHTSFLIMSSNLVRNLTYVAVAACFLALMSLIYRSAKTNKEKKLALEGTESTIGSGADDSANSRIYEDEGADGGESALIDTTLSAADDVIASETTGGKMTPTPRGTTSIDQDLNVTQPSSTIIEDDATPSTGSTRSVAPRKSSIKPKPSVAHVTPPKATTQPLVGPPAPPKTPPTLIAKGGSAFSVIAGAFSSEASANAQKKTLIAAGFKNAKLVPNGTTFRVSAGTFPSRKEADSAVAKLKASKISAFVAPLTAAK